MSFSLHGLHFACFSRIYLKQGTCHVKDNCCERAGSGSLRWNSWLLNVSAVTHHNTDLPLWETWQQQIYQSGGFSISHLSTFFFYPPPALWSIAVAMPTKAFPCFIEALYDDQGVVVLWSNPGGGNEGFLTLTHARTHKKSQTHMHKNPLTPAHTAGGAEYNWVDVIYRGAAPSFKINTSF